MMSHTIVVTGDEYHQKKPAFHKLLKKYNLRWKGKLPNFRWIGIGQSVVATFVRVNDETKEATIKWMGPSETQFLTELKELFEEAY